MKNEFVLVLILSCNAVVLRNLGASYWIGQCFLVSLDWIIWVWSQMFYSVLLSESWLDCWCFESESGMHSWIFMKWTRNLEVIISGWVQMDMAVSDQLRICIIVADTSTSFSYRTIFVFIFVFVIKKWFTDIINTVFNLSAPVIIPQWWVNKTIYGSLINLIVFHT